VAAGLVDEFRQRLVIELLDRVDEFWQHPGRAAMIYQHATREHDKSIAAALGKLLDATREDSK
jgi:hypothetical protein